MKDLNYYISKVRKLSDFLDTPIDEGIIELVAALHMHGFHTSGSCEGHDNEYGLFYPFVTLNFPEPEGYHDFEGDEESEELAFLREQWLKKNLGQQEKLIKLLQEFYQGKEVINLRSMLVVNTFGPSICELRPYGSELMFLGSSYKEDLKPYQNEMQRFCEFLIKKGSEN